MSVPTTEEHFYYHTIDLPDGHHEGLWDCRDVIDDYLGQVNFQGKTVLEVGPANGFFSFAMEQRGATVTCLDLGKDGEWDLVPGPQIDKDALRAGSRIVVERIENAFRHARGLLGSEVTLKQGAVYTAGERVAMHQIGTVGNVLQHLRDPIGGLMALGGRVTETLIVTECLWHPSQESEEPFMSFVPRASRPELTQSWWLLSVGLMKEAMKMLGFGITRELHHSPTLKVDGEWQPKQHITLVGSRVTLD